MSNQYWQDESDKIPKWQKEIVEWFMERLQHPDAPPPPKSKDMHWLKKTINDCTGDISKYDYKPLEEMGNKEKVSCPHKNSQIFTDIEGEYCSDCGRWV